MVTKSFTCPNGHQWWDDDQCERCPICGAAAAETVGGESSPHQSTDGGSQAKGDSSLPQLTAQTRFGRYQIVDELGRGGMGIVYRAYDPQNDRQVALKTLPGSDPTLLSRFKREFRLIAGIDHPNVVKLYELTSDGDAWFFTMEIVDGVDLLSHLRFAIGPAQPLAPKLDEDLLDLTQDLTPVGLSPEKQQRLIDAFGQLAAALGAMHGQGIVHRDIKPSNVIVTRAGRLVLLDFGLVAETDSSGLYQSLHHNVMGTAAYMSPEQAACEPVTTASDWYSVGVMLYQALTGRLPFAGKAIDVMLHKQNRQPVPPREIDPSTPRELNDLCQVLLCRSPENRPTAKEVLQRLGADVQPTTTRTASSTDEIGLVGRESHLQTLHEAWRDVRAGEAKSVFIEGLSGTGKSALVEAFLRQADDEGAVVLKGRCYEMESVPFKAIDSLIDSLVEYLTRLPEADAAALMPRDVHSLARLFPVFGQVQAVSKLQHRHVEVADRQELNRRAIGGLRELLARLGDRCALAVYIDDLQWGDEDSAAMLSDLLQPTDPPVMLFLGTYRSEDSETSRFLQAFRLIQRQREMPVETGHVQVAALEYSDAVKLALMLLQSDRADATISGNANSRADLIARETAGNPFFVSELVKHLQLQGERAPGGDEPRVLADMIWSRVRRLPENSQRLLAVVSLWGQPLPLELATQIAEVGSSAAGPLRTGHLARTLSLGSSSRIETYHDRVRESVAARLDPAVRQKYHLRIAQQHALQSSDDAQIIQRVRQQLDEGGALDDYCDDLPSNWYDIAFHFDAAGKSDLAFPYALATAEQSRGQYSLEMSEQQYRIAERGLAEHSDMVKYRVAEGLGDVLMLRGKYPEAAEQFSTALKLAIDADTEAQIEGKLGELAFKQGDNKAACDALERAIRLLGRRIPTRKAGFLAMLGWELFAQTWHTLLPSLFQSRRSLRGADRELLAISLHTHLSRAYFFDRGSVPCLWTHLRSVNLAETYPPTLELAHAWAAHAPVMTLIPWLSRGEAFAKKSLEIRRGLGDVCGQGQSLNYLGIVMFVGARYDECIHACREGTRLLEQTGDYWEVNIARYNIANSLYRKGELAEAVRDASKLYEVAHEMGDDKSSGFSLDVWSRASGGQLPAEVCQRELNKDRHDVQATAQVLLAEAIRLLGQSDLSAAEQTLMRARGVCQEVGMMNAWVSPVLSWLATVRRLQWQAASDAPESERRKVLSSARRIARQAVAVAKKFQTDSPHALREAGLIEALCEVDDRAQSYLDQSLKVAQQQNAKFELAQTRRAKALAGTALGWETPAQETANAKQALVDLGGSFALAYDFARQ